MPSSESFRPGDLVERHRSVNWTACPACGLRAAPDNALATVEALTYDPSVSTRTFLELREFPVACCRLHGPGWDPVFWRLVHRPRAAFLAELLTAPKREDA